MHGKAFDLTESMSAAEHARDFLRRTFCAAYGDEFFLYEKMGRRALLPAWSTSEAEAEILPPITPKRRESKGTRPLGRRLAGSRPAALTLGQRPRGLPFPGKGRERGMLKMKGWLQ